MFFVITGGPGSGKTTLIEELKRRGIHCIEEVARKIIQDEMAIGGEALPGKNIRQRIEMMLIHSIETYKEAIINHVGVTIFDRGILDYLSYAYRTKTPIAEELHQAARSLVYHKKAFIAPPWVEIYSHIFHRSANSCHFWIFRHRVGRHSNRSRTILYLPDPVFGLSDLWFGWRRRSSGSSLEGQRRLGSRRRRVPFYALRGPCALFVYCRCVLAPFPIVATD